MPDLSHLDSRYFVDDSRYNCPFCGRRHVVYSLDEAREFDWTDSKTCTVFFIQCESCERSSMHLSFVGIRELFRYSNYQPYKFNQGIDIDDSIFYSVPSSLHAIDPRIPKELRELVSEAEGCLKSNFLTGASACARKVIYELSERQGGEGENYDEKLKSLKAKLPQVEPSYFDTLLTIQQVTSSKVHENSNDSWESKHLKLILAALIEILQEIYVVPAVRDEKRKSIIALKAQVMGDTVPTEADPES